MLRGALGFGIGLHIPRVGLARAADDDRQARPHKGDRLVTAYGDRAGQVIRPDDLTPGGPQVLAFPMDPSAKVVRDGSVLNQIALLRFDPSQLSEDTRAQAADGVVAYSAICTHQGCPISMWQAETKTLFCSCHASRFDPTDRARVVDGPAPRRLPMLPLQTSDGTIVVAGEFSSRVGGQTQ